MSDPIPTISLHQPWATLCVTRQGCIERPGQCPRGSYCLSDVPCRGRRPSRMVKRFETRTRRPPSTIVGKRVLIHATKNRDAWRKDWETWRLPEVASIIPIPWKWGGDPIQPGESTGDDPTGNFPDTPYRTHFPLGAIVGSAIIGEGIPIAADQDDISDAYWGPECIESSPVYNYLRYWPAWDGAQEYDAGIDISDQLPYGDWTVDRWAWPLTDARPITEWCPWCWGTGTEPWRPNADTLRCRACSGLARLPDPIPWKGRQGVFYVPAEAVSDE